MKEAHRNLLKGRHGLVFAFSVLLYFMGYGLHMELFSLLAHYRGLSFASISWASTFHALGFYGTALASLWVVALLRYKGSYLLCAAVSTLSAGSMLFITTWQAFALMYMAVGASVALIYVSIDAWINEACSCGDRGRTMGIYSLIIYLGMMGGAYLLHIGHVGSAVLPLTAVALFSLSLGVLLFGKAPSPHQSFHNLQEFWSSFLSMGRLLLVQPLGPLGMFAMGATTEPFWTLGPLFAHQAPILVDVAAFMGIATLGAAASQHPFGKLSDMFGREKIILLTAACGSLACLLPLLLLHFKAGWAPSYYGTAFVYGFFTSPLYILCAALIFDEVQRQGGVFYAVPAWYLMIYGLGNIAGSLLNSSLALLLNLGASTIFLPGIFFNAIVALVAFRVCWRGSRVPVVVSS